MKTKNVKKLMALLLSASMVAAAFVGCGEQKTDAPSTEKTQESDSKEEESTASAAEPEDTIKWSGTITYAPNNVGQGENDVVWPLIKEKLLEYGYDVELEHVYYEKSQYNELVGLKMASGDAPDILFCNGGADLLNQYREQGLIATWDEAFFRENAPDVAAFIDRGDPDGINADYADVWWTLAKSGEEQMACIPTYSLQSGCPLYMVYNKTWLDNLGAEVPETLDEFVDLMYRFANEDPDGNGKDDTYGFSKSCFDIIFGAYGSHTGFSGFDSGHFYDVDGKLVSSNIMESNKDALELLVQLNKDGIIDPEWLTGENQGGDWALSHSFVNGRIGVTFSAPYGRYWSEQKDEAGNITVNQGSCLTELKAIQGADAEIVYGPFIEGPTGKRAGFLRDVNTVMDSTIYNAELNDDPEKLAAIFAIMNLICADDELMELFKYGIEGEHYEVSETGAYVWINTDKYVDTLARREVGVDGYSCIYGSERPFNATYYKASLSSPSNIYWDSIVNSHEGLGKTVGHMSDLKVSLPSNADYSEELNTYRSELWTKIIQGEVELDWDAFVAEYNKRGNDVLTKEANEWYETMK